MTTDERAAELVIFPTVFASVLPAAHTGRRGVLNDTREGEAACGVRPSPRALASMVQRWMVSSGAVWEPVVGYSRAVRVGPWVAVAGTTAAADGGGAVGGDDVAAQAREALRRIEVALAQVGAGLADVLRTRIFVTDIARWEEVGRVHGEFFGSIRPAATMVQVAALIEPELLVEIEADAVVTE